MVPHVKNRAATQRREYNKPLQQRTREALRGKTSAPASRSTACYEEGCHSNCQLHEKGVFSAWKTKLSHAFHLGLIADRRKRRGGNTGKCFHSSDDTTGKSGRRTQFGARGVQHVDQSPADPFHLSVFCWAPYETGAFKARRGKKQRS